MIQLAAEITAWFRDIDEAEYAARQLRRRGHGIRSLKIRQPRPGRTGDSLPTSLAALTYYGTASGQTWLSGGNIAGVPAAFPGFLDDSDAVPGRDNRDGPDGREDCLMVIRSEERQAQLNAALLTALHAQNLHVVTGLP